MIRTSQMSDTQFAEFIKSHPVSGGKGDQTAQNTENSQSNFVNTLQSAFATNNAQQQSQLNFLNNKLQNTIDNPQGYSPATLAAMRTQATDQVAAENQNVERSVNNMEAVRGGAAALPSGVDAQINAGVESQAAQAGNAAQQNITQQNANLQVQEQQQAENEELGVAQAENPEGMAGESNQGAGEVSSLSQAVTQSSGPTIGAIATGLGSAALGAAGTAL